MLHEISTMLDRTEERRRKISAQLNAKHRSRLSQFFTPAATATFLAALLDLPETGVFRLLDPGAGVGSLSAAVVARALSERPKLDLRITAFELDPALIKHLDATLADCQAVGLSLGSTISFETKHADFIEYATSGLLAAPGEYEAVVSNPPYKKVSSTSPERMAAAARGLQASNLYTIFTGLAADLLTDGGQMSIIVPRSWANGPYHRPFRQFLLQRIGIDFLHVYESRGEVFADSDVLQENIVLHGVRGRQPATVVLSNERRSERRTERRVRAEEVVQSGDPHMFVRIPIDDHATSVAEQIADLPMSLDHLGLVVSTGRVVDFRAKDWLRDNPGPDTVPLIYPGHLRNGQVCWPTLGSKKPNAIVGPEPTAKLMIPNETYVLVKRFSAKEERRRVSAAVLEPQALPPETPAVGVENHLNFFHLRGHGLDRPLAFGLSGYLNSTLVDEYVRIFSGHTQINATDLRQLRYPTRDALHSLGLTLMQQASSPDQAELDRLVAFHACPTTSTPTTRAAA